MSIYRGRNTKEFYLASALYDSIEDLNASAVYSLVTVKGADPNIVLPGKGISPLHLAIGSEDASFALQTTLLLLQFNGNPNVRSDEGLTPLHIAAAWGRGEIVKLLLNTGADPDIKDYTYQTARDYALEEEFDDIAQMIKDHTSQEMTSFFESGRRKINFNLTLDKIIVNNGQAVAEYEALKDDALSIDLKVLPQTNTTDYVRNWCNTLETQMQSLDQGYSDIQFENVTVSRPKVQINSSFDQDFCKFSEKSRESGILTLPNSLMEEDFQKPLRKISTARSKDTSSDYYTCTEVSENANLFEQNIFEMSSNVSEKSIDLNNALINSLASDQTFVSVSEVYRYIDDDQGVVLFEKRRIPPAITANANANDSENFTVSSKSSALSSLPRSFDYDTDTLRKELKRIGFEPGPITKTTKKVYLRKLYNLKKNPTDVPLQAEGDNKKIFSNEVQKTLRTPDWSSDLTPYRILEEAVSKQFANVDPNRRWREGVNKSSFTYLLLDPRISQNLPCRADSLSPQERWEVFLNSIFYVGKGKRSRPYQHLYDATSLYNRGERKTENKKLQHILDIWGDNQGVVCLHVFQNIIPVEAYTREAAMISALKLDNIDNLKSGEFYGVASTWTGQQKRTLGVYLLFRALGVFLHEGERQLSPQDID